MRILIIHGPNLNRLGARDPEHYGAKTLAEIDGLLATRAQELGAEVVSFQSNSEGALIDFIQAQAPQAAGIVINPGALTHYGLSLRDALEDAARSYGLPIVEVHLSNIHAREGFRRRSVIAGVATGQVSGLGWRSYLLGLEAVVGIVQEKAPSKA